MVFNVLGSVMLLRFEKPLNALSAILVAPLPIEMLVRFGTLLNAVMFFKLAPIIAFVRLVQPSNALLPTLVTLSGITILAMLEQP